MEERHASLEGVEHLNMTRWDSWKVLGKRKGHGEKAQKLNPRAYVSAFSF